jgi:carbon storage regulator
MLVLSRQRDETIMIGDDIEVTVVDIRGDKVRLGITAPREVSVHRKEVYDAIRRENRAAAQVKPEDLSGLGKMDAKTQNKSEGKSSAEGKGSAGEGKPSGAEGKSSAAEGKPSAEPGKQ